LCIVELPWLQVFLLLYYAVEFNFLLFNHKLKYEILGLASSIFKCEIKPFYGLQTSAQMEIQNVLKIVYLILYLRGFLLWILPCEYNYHCIHFTCLNLLFHISCVFLYKLHLKNKFTSTKSCIQVKFIQGLLNNPLLDLCESSRGILKKIIKVIDLKGLSCIVPLSPSRANWILGKLL